VNLGVGSNAWMREQLLASNMNAGILVYNGGACQGKTGFTTASGRSAQSTPSAAVACR
jgi:hypothetical protein